MLREDYGVNSIGLFGSVVRPDFSPEKSDIDIMVDFNRPRDPLLLVEDIIKGSNNILDNIGVMDLRLL